MAYEIMEKRLRMEGSDQKKDHYDKSKLLNQKEMISESFDDCFKIYETKALEDIKETVCPIYDNCFRIADKIAAFDTYKEHYQLDGGHIKKVHDKTLQTANVLEEYFAKNTYNGTYTSDIDKKALEVMALYHDTGMDGNIEAEQFEKLSECDREKFVSEVRERHSVQSAVHVLRDREIIEKKGVNADAVALGCLLHSKSFSGVKKLNDNQQWFGALDKLESAVDEFNKTEPDDKISFDVSFLKKNDTEIDLQQLAKIRTASLCLRIGDANGHDYTSCTSQNGKTIDFDLNEWDLVAKRYNESPATSFMDEVKYARVSIDELELDDSNDSSGRARVYALGEGNFKNLEFQMEEGRLKEKISLVKGDAYPLSTQFCIEERIREIKTAGIEPDITAEIDLGKVSEQTKYSYYTFADRVKRKYRIPLEVKYESAAK